jgi:hypothetical protein
MTTDIVATRKRATRAPSGSGKVHRSNIDVLEGFIMLAVVDDRPGDTGHELPDIDVKGIAQVDIRKDGRFEITPW